LGPVLDATEGTSLAVWEGMADSSLIGDALGSDVAVSLGDSDPISLGAALLDSLGKVKLA